jgi:hypothetical protein
VDLLLDLRQGLLHGQDWEATLDLFLECRHRLELAHYLPFYRLRQLMTHRLALEIQTGSDVAVRADLRRLLRLKFASLAHIRQMMERESFEAGHGMAAGVRVVEV